MPKLHVGDQDQSRLSYSYKNLCNVYWSMTGSGLQFQGCRVSYSINKEFY